MLRKKVFEPTFPNLAPPTNACHQPAGAGMDADRLCAAPGRLHRQPGAYVAFRLCGIGVAGRLVRLHTH